MSLSILDPAYPEQPFPNPELAFQEPDGLLAIGGCLSPQRIINAYSQGIFPWYNPGEPILWWSPNPRLVLFPEQLNISRSLNKKIRKRIFDIRFNTAFETVINACADPRQGHEGTWITAEMKQAYLELHKLKIAHSCEAFLEGSLVGGLYGLAIGRVFFGESMFHTETDASKVAFATLVEQLKHWGYRVIDCQVHSNHLVSLGAVSIPRQSFIKLLDKWCAQPPATHSWQT